MTYDPNCHHSTCPGCLSCRCHVNDPDPESPVALDQSDPVGGTTLDDSGQDAAGNPAIVAEDQEPTSRFGDSA